MAAIRFARYRSPAITAAALVVAAAVSLSGCSSGASGHGHSNATTATTATASTDVAAGRASGGASASPAAAPSASSSGAVRTSAGGGLAGGASFCRLAALAQAAQSKSANALTVDSPASLQKFEKQALDTLSGFVASAPSAIKGDVKVLVAADQKLYAALSAAHFNIRNINPDSLSGLQTPAFNKAVTAITAYLATSCGISTAPTG